VPLLTEAYLRLRKDAASGVDGETWSSYGVDLDARLLDLEGAYIAAATIRCRCGESTSRKVMAVFDRSAFPRWRTRSSNKRCG